MRNNIVNGIFRNPYRIITTDTLQRLAKVLGVPATELLEDVPDEEAKRDAEERVYWTAKRVSRAIGSSQHCHFTIAQQERIM